MSKQKKAKIFAAAVGFYGRRKSCFRTAVRAVHKSWQYAYIGRKLKKRDMRAMWIQQINAGARLHGLSYAKLLRGLEASSIELNRKSLANLAATEPYSFKSIVEAAKMARSASSKAEPQLR